MDKRFTVVHISHTSSKEVDFFFHCIIAQSIFQSDNSLPHLPTSILDNSDQLSFDLIKYLIHLYTSFKIFKKFSKCFDHIYGSKDMQILQHKKVKQKASFNKLL